MIGAIATFRDKSEVNALAEQLTGVSRYAESAARGDPRSSEQAARAAGAGADGDLDALRAYLRDLADHQLAPATALVEGIGEPVLAGFLLGKQAKPASAASFSRWRSNIRSRPPRRNGSTAW